jgi:hypothetical protein
VGQLQLDSCMQASSSNQSQGIRAALVPRRGGIHITGFMLSLREPASRNGSNATLIIIIIKLPN